MSGRVRTQIAVCAFCLLAPSGVLFSQVVNRATPSPEGICGSTGLSDPDFLSRAISNTRRLDPETYRLMEESRKRTVSATTIDTVGLIRQFFVCDYLVQNFHVVGAVLAAKGALTEIWVDTSEIANGHVDDAVVASIERALESSTPKGSMDPGKGIVGLEESLFGMPPNLGNSNGFVHFLITDIRDGWDSTSTDPYIAGFFFPNDQPIPSIGAYGPGSNKLDLLYIDSYPGIYCRGERNPERPLPVLAHELQHLIHWRYDPHETLFINEGCSENASVICGYPMRSPSDYYANTNVSLLRFRSGINADVIADYSRAALFVRYMFEQFGDNFARALVQNPLQGLAGIRSTLAEAGSSLTFEEVMKNWAVANVLNDTSVGRQYGYRYPITVKPTPSRVFQDPNVCFAADTVEPTAIDYMDFPSGDSLRVRCSSAGVEVCAVQTGSEKAVRFLSLSQQLDEPSFGSTFDDIRFAIVNLSISEKRAMSLSSSGNMRYVRREISYDTGVPDTLDGSPFIGLTPDDAGSGWAVSFFPASSRNRLTRAKIYIAFGQELSGSSGEPAEKKRFLFHVWGNDNGLPGKDIIAPFVVQVDRVSLDRQFFDVDLAEYASLLTDLPGPVFVGFTEYGRSQPFVGLNHDTEMNHTYASKGWGNRWEPMSDLEAGGSLAGWNVMIRAVFDYLTESSSLPRLVVGIVQDPDLSSRINVVCTGDSALREESVSGFISRPTGRSELLFSRSGSNRFVSTSRLVGRMGEDTIGIKAASLFGAKSADTSFVFSYALTGVDTITALASPDGDFHAEIPFMPERFFLTAYRGTADALGNEVTNVYSVGPRGKFIAQRIRFSLDFPSYDRTGYAPAIYRDNRWRALPVYYDNGKLVTSTDYLSTFAIVPRAEIDSSNLPTDFVLYQNYPNPFNPRTTIAFEIPKTSRVTLTILDVLGRQIADFDLGTFGRGHQQIIVDAAHLHLASGVYFYRVKAGEYYSIRKMVLLK